MTNNLWIGANILINTTTGETTQVLQFVFREEDATAMREDAARNLLEFVKPRAAPYAVIKWSIEKSSTRQGFYVIRGVQEISNG
ncbi:MAG TPA: hypothetical protein VK763_03170 [Terriglobales bacterium]|jgi:hypothetical protein|nr:hypothetical protein [Terriglobales bacterium]